MEDSVRMKSYDRFITGQALTDRIALGMPLPATEDARRLLSRRYQPHQPATAA
eukprot:m.15939 g.15939  ORF g.15939 m.15939 type:complete len:53 (-) comp4983_c0_seq1:1389-1547(-)